MKKTVEEDWRKMERLEKGWRKMKRMENFGEDWRTLGKEWRRLGKGLACMLASGEKLFILQYTYPTRQPFCKINFACMRTSMQCSAAQVITLQFTQLCFTVCSVLHYNACMQQTNVNTKNSAKSACIVLCVSVQCMYCNKGACMPAVNTVKNYEGFTIVASEKQLPMGNNFLQHTLLVEQPEPNEVQAYVQCTANSKEPGRIYFVAYSKTTGALVECYTID